MKRELVINVFGTLQSLEKAITVNRANLEARKEANPDTTAALAQQERVTNQMRRTANRLQFELIGDNWGEVVRLLKIFYGLHHMVRPEILKTSSSLTSKHPPLEAAPVQAVIH